jgi:L-alanine-DL-glutamate epimerase-like enolase superfamily enzyme
VDISGLIYELMLNWTIEQIRLDLKYTWKLSRNATDFKLNNIVTVSDGKVTGKGEVAPNIRYNETPESMLSEFERFRQAEPGRIESIEELTEMLAELKLPNALRFGIESAYIHWECAKKGQGIYHYLGIEQPSALYTAFSLPIMPANEIAEFYSRYDLARFKRLKLKVNADQAHELLQAITSISSQPLIIDANEGWKDPDALLSFLHELKPYHIDIIEQPMPAGMDAEYAYVKTQSPFTLMADESVCDHADFEQLKTQFHGINMKLMKAGGYINGLRLLNEARKHNMRTMVGCMIETSLGISSAMHVCSGVEFVDLDGFMIVKDEPYQLIAEQNGRLEELLTE